MQKTRARAFSRFGIRWAPVGKLLAITCDGRVQILDTSAEDLASISIRHPKFEYPAVFGGVKGGVSPDLPAGQNTTLCLLIQPAADSLALPVSIAQSFCL